MCIDLSFIILTWNSEDYIEQCIFSFSKQCENEHINCQFIVVDNGSNDTTLEKIKELNDGLDNSITLISLPDNMGTTYTRNIGIKKSVGKYVCVLDSDTEFGAGSIKQVLDILNSDKRFGIIAPKLVLGDGTIQNSVKKFPTFMLKLKKTIKAIFKVRIVDNDFYEDFPFEKQCEVDSAISACWFFRKELVGEVGYLDENIFYAPEDVDYSMVVKKAGYSVVFFPELKITHFTQQISHKQPFSKLSLSHFWGLMYYFRKHGGWFKA
ncbi:glycosyltransferase family 2 protein [Desulfosediminicola flagellatus]|uniref:glycosyltransferase family 2 protein n=1 Tax=Desulfosediminicola flagellatus TaxID=2569541 RepID=UPI0010AD33F0|nr:glycosyltransferase family 2 protein [Desulfosediminicola flagellatus]